MQMKQHSVWSWHKLFVYNWKSSELWVKKAIRRFACGYLCDLFAIKHKIHYKFVSLWCFSHWCAVSVESIANINMTVVGWSWTDKQPSRFPSMHFHVRVGLSKLQSAWSLLYRSIKVNEGNPQLEVRFGPSINQGCSCEGFPDFIF